MPTSPEVETLSTGNEEILLEKDLEMNSGALFAGVISLNLLHCLEILYVGFLRRCLVPSFIS